MASPDGTSCNGNNSCELPPYACSGGSCVGITISCVASDSCHTAGSCDPTSGACTNPAAGAGTACDDGNAYLSGLRWTAWGSTAAATGTWRINDCVPNCAAGTFHSFAATVKLWQPEPLPRHAGAGYYSKITIDLPDSRCYAAAGKRSCYPASYTGTLRSTPVIR